MQKKPLILALLAGLALSGAAQAALNDRGGGLIYDDVLDLTWLQDANYAKTSGYDADGKMTWSQATTWAANLSYYDSVRGVTYTDWRLPTTGPVNGSTFNDGFSYIGSTDYGYNVSEQGTAYAGSTGSEMAHLYYNSLDNKAACNPVTSTAGTCVSQSGSGLINGGLFTNFHTGTGAYWSGTENALSTSKAWNFTFYNGSQSYNIKPNVFFAMAVRPGDVAAVPEADTWAMLLAGLGLVGVAARRRRG
ncbi:MAG: PEPxxWA-CTERM sorting domain-containing protein [Pseudomonadota bacterium]|nr:PEPxxWA-CTERM sorting domain-containing protein [Pseudomonadota bacterium]